LSCRYSLKERKKMMSAQVGKAQALSAPDEQQLRDVAGMFALLGDLTRVSVLHALAAAGELRVSDLARTLGRDASTISHVLRVLRDHDLVTYEKRGRVAVYRLADSHVLMLFQQALAHAAHQSPIALPLAEASAVREG
jgi:DNA-binding transcriptional ArsR family regulator